MLTTIHSNSCEATYRRMVSLCKRAVDMSDETLMGYVTEAYPIIVFCKQRRVMEIMECEILPDGSRNFRPLFQYTIMENRIEDARFIIDGRHGLVQGISPGLQKRFLENEVFREWCDAIAACRYDRNLKTTLTPIVSKLSDMRIVNAELEYMVFEPRKEFIIMVILVIGNIPIMYFLNRSWYETLMHTAIEQFVLAVCAAAIFISTAFVIRLTKPIEYRR